MTGSQPGDPCPPSTDKEEVSCAAPVLAAFWPHNGAQRRHRLRITEQHRTSSSGVRSTRQVRCQSSQARRVWTACSLMLTSRPWRATRPMGGNPGGGPADDRYQIPCATWLGEGLVVVRFFQRGVDVIFQRGRHTGGGGDDPAEPGHRGDRQQHVSDLVLRRARRQRPGGAPSRQTADDPMATDAATCSSATVLASRADGPARPGQNSGSANSSSKIASLRSVSWKFAVRPIRLPSPSALVHRVPDGVPSHRWG